VPCPQRESEKSGRRLLDPRRKGWGNEKIRSKKGIVFQVKGWGKTEGEINFAVESVRVKYLKTPKGVGHS